MASKMKYTLLLLIAFSLVLFTITLVFFIVTSGQVPFDYGLTIDAGSSHSEVILFTWSEKSNGTSYVKQKDSCYKKNGIDDAGDNITETLNGLYPCVQSMVDKISPDSSGPFPLFLGATAGMRILNITAPSTADLIFKAIEKNFSMSNFNGRRLEVHPPRILTGEEEGRFAWISANYLLTYIPPEKRQLMDEVPECGTIGILDMGGASAQIAYQAMDQSQEYVEEEMLFGRKYNVRAFSNLCFGSDQGHERYLFSLLLGSPNQATITDPCAKGGPSVRRHGRSFVENPCLATKGSQQSVDEKTEYVFQGATNYDPKACREQVEKIFNLDECKRIFGDERCFKTDRSVKEGIIFYALSSYFYTTKVLPSFNSSDHVKSEEQLMKEIDEWCQLPWDDKKSKWEESHANSLCFKQHFMVNTLKNIYHFNSTDWNRIHFSQKIGGQSLGWSLGFMLRETNQIPLQDPKSPTVNLTWLILVTFFTGLVLLGSAVYYIRKRRSVNF
ncbi:ectonucleoside triphosphate diphosphohydrolase 1-like [Brevipalpus obovatus]|uniref:ectonucleoside triphosphate diphosphohydrolase 1-like n=1 Tax=Brevipalpus obovatus TaxID=246614 RepID=UPI003D9EA65B